MPEAALERLCRRPSLIAAPSSFPTEPQTLHVYEGDSWDTALGEANAGDCIVIHPGLHKERVVIRKSGITIRGVDAASVKMHVRHADSAVTFNMCRNVRFENITVRNETGPGIRIVKAAPTIASCTISGLTGGILVARNAESPGFYPTVQRCNISKCARGPGIALSDARAVVEDCVIQHNSDAGILCEGRSNPWIKGNTVSKGRGAGIALLSQASGVLRDNVIEENTCTGIVIEGGSSPIALRNVIRNGKAEGVKVDGASKARFEGNEFSGNSVCELFVGKGCDVACVRCSFHSGRGVGVSVQEGVVTLKKNTFHSFDAACVSVVGSAGSVIESNVFTIGLQPGIVLGERSGAIVERNEFHVTVPGNTFTTVSAKQSPSLHVADNRVKHVEPRETERPADVLQSETLRRNEVQALFKSPRAADDDEDGDDRLDSGDDSGLDISISGSNYSLSSMTKTGSFFEKTEAGVPDGNGTGISAKRRHSAFAERLLCLAAVNAQGRRRSEGSPLPLPETPPRHHADGLAHPALRPRLSPSASGSGSTAVANLHSAKQHVPGAGSSPTAGNGHDEEARRGLGLFDTFENRSDTPEEDQRAKDDDESDNNNDPVLAMSLREGPHAPPGSQPGRSPRSLKMEAQSPAKELTGGKLGHTRPQKASQSSPVASRAGSMRQLTSRKPVVGKQLHSGKHPPTLDVHLFDRQAAEPGFKTPPQKWAPFGGTSPPREHDSPPRRAATEPHWKDDDSALPWSPSASSAAGLRQHASPPASDRDTVLPPATPSGGPLAAAAAAAAAGAGGGGADGARRAESRRSSATSSTGLARVPTPRRVRASSAGVRARSKSGGKKPRQRTVDDPAPVGDLTEAEVLAQLEVVRKMLAPQELRQELQLLKNWIGPTRLAARST